MPAVLIPWSALARQAGQAALRAAGSALVEAGRRKYCEFASQNPDWYTASPVGSFAPGVGEFVVDSLNQTICPAPDYPSPPFPGTNPPNPNQQGQCAGVRYLFDWSWFNPSTGQTFAGTSEARGPLSQLRGSLVNNGSSYGYAYGVLGRDANGNPQYVNFLFVSPDDDPSRFNPNGPNNIRRVDGQPDNCGLLPPSPGLPTIPDPSGWVNVPVPVPRRNLPPINLPWTLKPTLFDVTVNANLAVNINLGGIDISFNFEGAVVRYPDVPTDPDGDRQFPPGNRLPPGSPSPQPPLLPPSPDGECDLTEVIDLLEDIQECVCLPEPPYETISYEEVQSREVTLPAGAISVSILLTTIPANPKSEPGLDAPTVYYAGWYSLGAVEGGNGERIPLSYAANYAIVSKLHTNVTFTCRAGFKAAITIYYKPPEA